MKSIPLFGKYSDLSLIIDDEDFEQVSPYRWLRGGQGKHVYARRTITRDGRQTAEFLHTFLTGWSLVDHINHDGLDNRRCNLRPATHAENRRNMLKRTMRSGRPSLSQYKGVAPKRQKWRAQIVVDRKEIYLGVFSSEEEAAHAYDKAARQYHGEFALLNFQDEEHFGG